MGFLVQQVNPLWWENQLKTKRWLGNKIIFHIGLVPVLSFGSAVFEEVREQVKDDFCKVSEQVEDQEELSVMAWE